MTAMQTVYARELKLMRVVDSMENTGVRVDLERFEEVEQFYKDELVKYDKKIRANGGEGLNPRSPKQMKQKFFGEFGLQPLRYSKKKRSSDHTPCQDCKGAGCKVCQDTGNNPKCDSEFLERVGVEKYEDENGKPCVRPKNHLAYWLLHNSAAKTMAGYVQNYRHALCKQGGDWIIHPNYNQAGAITGRFTASNPNLQNVAADDSGKKRVDVPYRPREVFIPRKNHVFLLPDYSQIEVWVLMLLSGDKILRDILLSGKDTHAAIASTLWPTEFNYDDYIKHKKMDPATMSDKQKNRYSQLNKIRKRSKNLQFCKIYGGGPGKIAEMIGDGCTIDRAKSFIADYDHRLYGIKDFMDRTVIQAKNDGKIINPYGRIYPIDPNFAYTATNYAVQGTSSEIIKNAMVRVHATFREEYDRKARLLLTIHDELMIEVHKSIYDENLMQRVVSDMAADYKFLKCPVPFPVGMKVATERWSETQEIKLAS